MPLPTIESPSESISLDFNEIGDDKISNYIKSYESNDFSIANDNDYSVEEFTTANEFDDSNLHEETVPVQGPEETIDVKVWSMNRVFSMVKNNIFIDEEN